jgi:hyperosmotically inducible periplasmic protein
MKTTMLLFLCGIGLAGCGQQNGNSQTSTPPPSNVAANNAPASNAPANNIPSGNNDVAVNPTTKPDNTAVNTRDRDADAITAGSQGQSQSDVNVTADIRRRIMNGNLSTYAQNVKIICQNGKVTLRGPVNNQQEKDAIGRIADDVAGADNVDNELEINPNG